MPAKELEEDREAQTSRAGFVREQGVLAFEEHPVFSKVITVLHKLHIGGFLALDRRLRTACRMSAMTV